MDKKVKKKIKKIVKICLIILLIELLILLGFWFYRKTTLEYVDVLNDVIEVEDGYVIVGYSNFHNSDFVDEQVFDFESSTTSLKGRYVKEQAKIALLDKDHNVVWENTYTNKKFNIFNSYFNRVIKVEDGYICVGSYQEKMYQVEEGSLYGLIVKYDNDGKQLWNKEYYVLSDTQFFDVVEDNGNYIVVGKSVYAKGEVGNHINGGGIILKLDKDGNKLELNNYGGNSTGSFNKVLKVNDGYICVGKDKKNTGIVVKFNKNFDKGEEDVEISSKIKWYRIYNGADSTGFTNIKLNDNKLYVLGSINSSNDLDQSGNKIYQFDFGIVVYSLDGKMLDEFKYGGDNIDRLMDITFEDNIYVVGITTSTNIDIEGYKSNGINSVLLKLDKDLKIIDKKQFSGERDSILIKITDDKLIGYNNNNGLFNGNYEYYFENYK